MTRITDLPAVGTITGNEQLEISQASTAVTITATTISAAASDNSYNDSGSGFVTAGFSVDDRVTVAGFTGDTANNIYAATVTAVTAGKLTIGGTDGDVIVDDAAGESVTISKWNSRRVSVSGATQRTYSDTLTITAAASGTWTIPANCVEFSYVFKMTGTTNHVITLALTNGGTAQSFDQMDFNLTGGTGTALSSSPSLITNNYITGGWITGGQARVTFPSSSSVKATYFSSLATVTSTEFRIDTGIQTAAGVLDGLKVSTSAGTLTGTVEISYTLLEA